MKKEKSFDFEDRKFKFEILENVSVHNQKKVLGWYIKGELFNDNGIVIHVDNYVTNSGTYTYSSYISDIVTWHLKRERLTKPFKLKRLLSEIKEADSRSFLSSPDHLTNSLAEFIVACKRNWFITAIVLVFIFMTIFTIVETNYTRFTSNIKTEAWESGYDSALISYCELSQLTENQRVELSNLDFSTKETAIVKSCYETLKKAILEDKEHTLNKYIHNRFYSNPK